MDLIARGQMTGLVTMGVTGMVIDRDQVREPTCPLAF
jgi:hypothetical protein